MDRTACLTCLQQPDDETDQQNICHSDLREIVRKHFWFSDAELAQAWICEVCWETISVFHQFYVDVEQLYETKPVPELEAVTVKEEKDIAQVMLVENEIKEEVLSDDMQEEFEDEQLYTVELKEGEEQESESDSNSDSDDSMSGENEADSESNLGENHPDNIIRRHVELTCQECDDAGSFTFKEFTIHAEKIHGNKKPFVMCCGSKYIKRCYLLEHVRYVLNPDAFLCKHCDEAFTSGVALKRHLKIRHGKGQTRRYNNENRLRKDKSAPVKNEEQLKKREEIELKRQQRAADDQIMLGHVKFECVPCGESFISFTQLHTHSTSKHKIKPVVTCCGNRYNSRCKLWQHVTSVLNPVAYRCELCMRCFNSEYAKDTHRRKMHPTAEELKYHCERCDKSFSREIAYKRHMQDHEDSDHGRIKCEECGKMFKSRTVLYMHVRKKHVAPQFVCDICAKAFHQPAEFEKHKLEHEDPDKLRMQCQHCLKWFKNREYWRTHIRLHNPTTPVPCELCDRVCQNKRAWRAHMKNAHGTPDKVCELCGKCFKKKQSLQEHIAAVHTGQKLFSCPFCPRNFNSSSNMHTHKKNMHTEEWQASKLGAVATTSFAGPSETATKATPYSTCTSATITRSHALCATFVRNHSV
uniref:Transcription factor grauzone n=1 Tax=Culex pipiens TaxID=7175 RepID=A0A8D8BL98_CULPI